MEQIIWYNSEMKIENKMIFHKGMYDRGIMYYKQQWKSDGTIKSLNEVQSEFDIVITTMQ